MKSWNLSSLKTRTSLNNLINISSMQLLWIRFEGLIKRTWKISLSSSWRAIHLGYIYGQNYQCFWFYVSHLAKRGQENSRKHAYSSTFVKPNRVSLLCLYRLSEGKIESRSSNDRYRYVQFCTFDLAYIQLPVPTVHEDPANTHRSKDYRTVLYPPSVTRASHFTQCPFCTVSR